MANDASPSTALAPARPQREITPVQDVIPIFDTHRFEHMQRIGSVLAMASIFPKHLRGVTEGRGQAATFIAFPKEQVIANAVVLVNQAERWNVDPFALAQCTYATPDGKIGYEGKMIAAVVQARCGVKFHYRWSGEGLQRKIIISDQPWDEAGALPHGARTVEGTVEQWATYNAIWSNGQKTGERMKDNWVKQPDMQLAYRGARVWANLYEPGIVVGVLSDEDLEMLEERRDSASAAPAAPRLTAGFGDETDKSFRTQGSPQARDEASGSPTAENTGEAAQASPGAQDGANSEATAETDEEHVQDAEFEDAEEVAETGGEGEATSTESQASSDASPEPDEETLRRQHEEALALATDLGREAANHGLPANPPEGMEPEYAERWKAAHAERLDELAAEEEEEKTTAAPGEVYLLVGEGYDEKGKRPTYKDGKPFSTVTEKGAAKLPVHDYHAPSTADEAEPKEEAAPEAEKKPAEETHRTPTQSNPFDECHERILAASGWLGIKQHVRTLAKTEAWAKSEDEGKRMVRLAAWERYADLRDAGEEKTDPADDISLFQLWLSFAAKTQAEVDGLFKLLFRSQAYREATDADKQAIGKMIEARKKELPAE